MKFAASRFAVIPLSEDCGFIEWVPQTVTLRNCCTGVYEAEGLFDRRLTLAGVSKIWQSFTVSLCWKLCCSGGLLATSHTVPVSI
jgi:hypothetical protein